jgi:hypothetical protein
MMTDGYGGTDWTLDRYVEIRRAPLGHGCVQANSAQSRGVTPAWPLQSGIRAGRHGVGPSAKESPMKTPKSTKIQLQRQTVRTLSILQVAQVAGGGATRIVDCLEHSGATSCHQH